MVIRISCDDCKGNKGATAEVRIIDNALVIGCNCCGTIQRFPFDKKLDAEQENSE